jgi:lysophospholipase L1-like esterase
LAVLVGKRLTPALGLLELMAIMLALILIGAWRVHRGSQTTSKRFVCFSLCVLWIAWGGMTIDWYASAHCRHRVLLKPDRPVICFGDSMTSLGALQGGYPRKLQERISLPIVDLGISGVSAKEAMESCVSELTRHNPQVVVIELGAHDFLRGYSRASTKEHLKRIIDAVRQIDAEVVLLEVPRAFMSDPYWGLEREIARQEDVELVPDTAMRSIFLWSTMFPPGTWLGAPYLTDETGIHPNERGNQILADHVAEALERMYGPGIRRQGGIPQKEAAR